MTATDINILYKAFLGNPIGLEPLLDAVTAKALQVTRDEDVSQTVAIEVWKALPALHIDVSFAAWLNLHIQWIDRDERRKNGKDALLQVPVIHDDEGHALSEDEAIDKLTFNERQQYDTNIRTFDIEDPVIRAVADCILKGRTQAEAGFTLGMKPAAIRQIIRRFRKPKQI